MMHVCDAAPYVGSTYNGGDSHRGSIFVMSCGGGKRHVETVYSFCGKQDPGCLNGRGPVGSLFRRDDGTLVGVTERGGKYDAGTLFVLTPPSDATPTSSWKLNVLKIFCGEVFCLDGGRPSGNLAVGHTRDFEVIFGVTRMGGAHGDGTFWLEVPGPKGNGFYVVKNFR